MCIRDRTEEERRTAGRLMRVNHCGEICAQALYLGQGLTSSNPATQQAMQQAAQEESDHLAWCEDRLEALDTHKSYLNPLFFAASFAGGAVTGLISDQVNLGFVAATEERVIDHLEAHLEQLPQRVAGRMRRAHLCRPPVSAMATGCLLSSRLTRKVLARCCLSTPRCGFGSRSGSGPGRAEIAANPDLTSVTSMSTIAPVFHGPDGAAWVLSLIHI